MKTYILQKDLPDGAKAGDEYIKNGDMYKNKRMDNINSPVVEHNFYFTWQVEKNEKWFKEKKEEKPTLRNTVWGANFIQFNFIDDIAISISRERLAEILIAESKGELHLEGEMYYPFSRSFTDMKYTENDLEKAFNAAREVLWDKVTGRSEYNDGDWSDIYASKYNTFSDFKNSIKK